MEPLELDSEFRYTFLPVKYDQIYQFYKTAQQAQWTPEELKEELLRDIMNWNKLDEDTQNFIKGVVAFFNVSDGIVVENIASLASRIKARDILVWYNHQAMMEDVHSETYSMIAEAYVSNPAERKKVFDAVKNYPAIALKIEWIDAWVGKNSKFDSQTRKDLRVMVEIFGKNLNEFLHLINYETDLMDPNAPIPRMESIITEIMDDDETSLAQIVMANVIMEGVFFSSAFAAIFWINHFDKGVLPGLSKANEWISRDEGMHTDVAITIYRKYIKNKLPVNVVHNMFKDALSVEENFVTSILPKPLRGMNSELMIQYVKFVADGLLADLNYPKIWNIENPFSWMDKQSVSIRSPDFFIDINVSEYSLPNDNGLSFSDDF